MVLAEAKGNLSRSVRFALQMSIGDLSKCHYSKRLRRTLEYCKHDGGDDTVKE